MSVARLKNLVIIFFRSEAMVGSSCRPLVALGHRGILPGWCGDATLAEHDGETDLCHGQGIVFGTCTSLHGRYPVGTPRDPAERYVTLLASSSFHTLFVCYPYPRAKSTR